MRSRLQFKFVVTSLVVTAAALVHATFGHIWTYHHATVEQGFRGVAATSGTPYGIGIGPAPAANNTLDYRKFNASTGAADVSTDQDMDMVYDPLDPGGYLQGYEGSQDIQARRIKYAPAAAGAVAMADWDYNMVPNAGGSTLGLRNYGSGWSYVRRGLDHDDNHSPYGGDDTFGNSLETGTDMIISTVPNATSGTSEMAIVCGASGRLEANNQVIKEGVVSAWKTSNGTYKWSQIITYNKNETGQGAPDRDNEEDNEATHVVHEDGLLVVGGWVNTSSGKDWHIVAYNIRESWIGDNSPGEDQPVAWEKRIDMGGNDDQIKDME